MHHISRNPILIKTYLKLILRDSLIPKLKLKNHQKRIVPRANQKPPQRSLKRNLKLNRKENPKDIHPRRSKANPNKKVQENNRISKNKWNL